MVVKNWRNIVEVDKEIATVSSRPIQELIIRDPQFRRMYPNEGISPRDIRIVDIQAGYMEAPVNYQQKGLRPGAVVTFQVGNTRELMSAQLVIPLEEEGNIEFLWGERFKSRK